MARKSRRGHRPQQRAKQARYERCLALCRDPSRPRRVRTRAARYASTLAEQLGLIHRPPCCDWCRRRRPLERHHVDYTEPLRVAWYCGDCHVIADAWDQADREELEADGDHAAPRPGDPPAAA
jgi:hypothetical protein